MHARVCMETSHVFTWSNFISIALTHGRDMIVQLKAPASESTSQMAYSACRQMAHNTPPDDSQCFPLVALRPHFTCILQSWNGSSAPGDTRYVPQPYELHSTQARTTLLRYNASTVVPQVSTWNVVVFCLGAGMLAKHLAYFLPPRKLCVVLCVRVKVHCLFLARG